MKQKLLTLLFLLLFSLTSDAQMEDPFVILKNIESCFDAKNIPTTLKYKSGILKKGETLSIQCISHKKQSLIKNLNVRIECQKDGSRTVYYKDKKIVINKFNFEPYKDVTGCGFTCNKLLKKEDLHVIYIEAYQNFKSIEFLRKYFTFKVNAFRDTYDKNGLNCYAIVITKEPEDPEGFECKNVLFITVAQYLVGWNKLQTYPEAKKAPFFIMERK